MKGLPVLVSILSGLTGVRAAAPVNSTGGFSSISTVLPTLLPSSSLSTSSPTSAHSTPTTATSFSVSSSFSSATRTSVLSTTTESSSSAPTTSSLAALSDVDIIRERRFSDIVGGLSNAESIPAWLSSLGSNGKWPDSEVDYTTGCDARRANWPAQDHWQRIVVMAGAWHGGLAGAEQYVKDNTIRTATLLAMNYWFSRDFTNPACLDSGGTASCPCTNPDNSLWNTNWFSNIILIPDLVGRSCVLLNETLSPAQFLSCNRITGRAYGTFDRNINGVGFLTGANTLDVAAVGIDLALVTANTTLLTDAYRRIHLELVVRNTVKSDGIRADGSFGQHGGILYNGNYGKDYTNDILSVEIDAGGTQFAANTSSQAAFATLFDGDRWMIYRNTLTGVLHWDFSVLGRFISFPVIDDQATESIKLNLSQVAQLGQQWSSNSLTNFADTLSRNSDNANAGNLVGNRLFYANDYMVHRGSNYVSTVKMFSTRTQNTECTNTQNPLGFHLADGVVHTYLRGDEYEDISVAWDWNLIPGTTVDYGATALSCDRTQFTGIERFVGGASNGKIGLAAMRYTNPFTKSLSWQKVWFFLDNNVQHVMVANVSSTTTSPVYSVLDQRRRSGTILVDGSSMSAGNFSGIKSLWHGNVGYVFPNGTALSVQAGQKSGSWATIGTSTQPPATVDLFSAWIRHISIATPVSYTAFPGTDAATFVAKSQELRLQSVQNDARASVVYDQTSDTVMLVFWDSAGGSATFVPSVTFGSLAISANGNVAIIYKPTDRTIVISDPSQSLATVKVVITTKSGARTSTITLPQGGLAGNSVSQVI